VKTIQPALQVKLDSGATTLCRCWVVTRADGVVQGFTDHDEDVALDAVTCRAGSGLAAAEATQQLGLAVTATEVAGALAADTLNEDDLAAGLYDAAEVEVWLLDWSEPALRVLMAQAVLGEVRREGEAFVAELRGLAHRLAEESGRLYTATCAADLGDARCTVDLANPAFRGSGSIVALTGTSGFTAAGLDAFADSWFTAGRLAWTGGSNAGLAVEVKRHANDGTMVTLDLWQAMAYALAPGDTFTVTAGCDKRFDTCRDRFANSINFRGFPHIPGNDFLIAYPVPGAPGNDGGSLFP
jgi:uncharacterized phage protein (TIGR02218 family)